MRKLASFPSGRGKIAMKLSHLLTASLAGALVCFIGGAEASPHSQAPMFSPLPIQAGLKCGLVDGQLVCGNKNSSKHHDDDDDQQGNDDDDHQGKGKKKNTDDGEGLSECTIQGQSGGGGCKTGFRRVCEKMKSGKKCCGCVPDPNAKTQTTPVQAQQVCCTASVDGVNASAYCTPTEAQSRELASGVKVNGKPPTSITCAPKK